MLQLQTSIKFIMYTVIHTKFDILNMMLNNHYVKNTSYIICRMEIN